MEQRKILPNTVTPIHYDLNLEPNVKDNTYQGRVRIQCHVEEATNLIHLNSLNLEIQEAKILEGNLTGKVEQQEEEIAVEFSKTLNKKDSVTLEITFKGKISKNMNGFYVSRYFSNKEEKFLYSTHFEPTAARRAFPCFDQPDLKATFSISLLIPKNLTAISNMSVSSEKEEKELKLITFKDTPKMSTYLVAFAFGELEYVEDVSSSVKIRVYTTEGEKENGVFALKVTVECLKFFEEYFGIKYPMDKLDNIAIPEFAMGAMENWGMITYRQGSLLYDEKNSSLNTKKRIAETVCHELAHQWFGNLVTMKWWNDLWLNEGFATWAAALGVSKLSKSLIDWDVWTSFISDEIETGMGYDALLSTHPIEVEVYDPNDINQIFDGISYSKGASMIRMLEDYMGPEVFQKGIKEYLKKYAYQNATTDDLWKVLTVESNKDVKGLMSCWTQKEGFPLVRVSEEKDKISIKQERFLLTGKSMESDTWFLPLRVKFYDQKFKEFKKILIEMKAKDAEQEKISDVFKFNDENVGFYRVLYSDDNSMGKIIQMLESNLLSPRNKLNLVNDFFQLSVASFLDIKKPLSISVYFKDEENYDVLASVLRGLMSFKSIFYGQKEKAEKIRNLILSLTSERVMNIDLKDVGENINDASLNAILVCVSAENEQKEIVEKLISMYEKFKINKDLVHPVYRTALFEAVVKADLKDVFEELLEVYKHSKIADERIMALVSLGATLNEARFSLLLKELMADTIKLQDKIYVFSAISANLKFRDEFMKFVMNNFSEIEKMFDDNSTLLSYAIERVFSFAVYEPLSSTVVDFLNKLNMKSIDRSVKKTLERISIRRRFVEMNDDVTI